MKLIRLFALVGIALANPAQAQTVTVTAPNTVNPSGQPTAINKTFIVNADGTIATVSAGGSGSVAQGSTTAGQSGSLVQCTVVTGNQAYTTGTTNPLNCIGTGRLKVAVSNAGNIDPAAQLSTTLTADLVAAKYYATRPTWVDGATGVIQADAAGNLYVNNATLAPGASTDATLLAQSAKLPASLGAKAGAASLSVVPNTDTPFPVLGNVASGATDAGNPIKIGGVFNSTLPTFASGQRGDVQVTNRGEIYAQISFGGTPILGNVNNTDALGVSTGANLLRTLSYGVVFNGTTWDRQRGDTTGTYVIGKGGSTIATGQVSVGTTATLIAAARPGRQKIGVTVTSATQCAYGNAGVTLTTGWPLAVVAYASDNWDTAAALYGVCAATATVGFREQF